MAWRPAEYLIEGELDNTTPGKVTGWMRFAGLKIQVTLDLQGNCHRDIRGAKIRLKGDGRPDDPEAAEYMERFAQHQTGEVGDITAGLPPRDYVHYPYLEWYSADNGRVVIELEPEQVELLTRPIPACESDPISRAEQANKMAGFLAKLSIAANVPAVVVGGAALVSDPTYTHWVRVDGQIVGEAREVQPDRTGTSFAYVRLFQMPEGAEYGTIENCYLQAKSAAGER